MHLLVVGFRQKRTKPTDAYILQKRQPETQRLVYPKTENVSFMYNIDERTYHNSYSNTIRRIYNIRSCLSKKDILSRESHIESLEDRYCS